MSSRPKDTAERFAGRVKGEGWMDSVLGVASAPMATGERALKDLRGEGDRDLLDGSAAIPSHIWDMFLDGEGERALGAGEGERAGDSLALPAE